MEFEHGSGNVFADLGFADAEERRVKADLALVISRLIADRGLTQAQAAEIIGIDQPKVSAIVRGRLSEFSLDRLMRFLTALGVDIELVTHEREHDGPGHLKVAVG